MRLKQLEEKNAVKRWQALSTRQQFLLIEEIVQTRHVELCAAYHVRAVGAGYRTRRYKQNKRRYSSDVCVKFVVEEKRGDATFEGRVPPLLYQFVLVRGKRVLCAVPTDVEQMADRAFRAQSNISIDGKMNGTATCLVKVPGAEDIFLLSCLHVLAAGTYVSVAGTRVARVSNIRGEFDPQSSENFDAALAKVEDGAAGLLDVPHQVFGEWSSNPNQRFKIRTSSRRIAADFAEYYMPGLPIFLNENYYTFKTKVVLYRFDIAETNPGDSGSAVISRGAIAGIHIAGGGMSGSSVGIGAMIPADELEEPSNWNNIPSQFGKLEVL